MLQRIHMIRRTTTTTAFISKVSHSSPELNLLSTPFPISFWLDIYALAYALYVFSCDTCTFHPITRPYMCTFAQRRAPRHQFTTSSLPPISPTRRCFRASSRNVFSGGTCAFIFLRSTPAFIEVNPENLTWDNYWGGFHSSGLHK